MSKRLSAVLAAAIAVCLFAPGVALARDTVKITGLKSAYTVGHGHGLTDSGKVVTHPNASDWSVHGRVQLQRLVDGSWTTVDKIEPSESGAFKFTLHKAAAGSYRVRFPGCEHYDAKNRNFVIKYSPKLSIGALSIWRGYRTDYLANRWLMLQARVTSKLPARYLKTGELTFRSYASTDNVTFHQIFVSPNGTSFGGSNEITMAPLPVLDWAGLSGGDIRSYKVRVYWSGNASTVRGSVLSKAFEAYL